MIELSIKTEILYKIEIFQNSRTATIIKFIEGILKRDLVG